MGLLSVIRRWALRDKMPIREIARRTGNCLGSRVSRSIRGLSSFHVSRDVRHGSEILLQLDREGPFGWRLSEFQEADRGGRIDRTDLRRLFAFLEEHGVHVLARPLHAAAIHLDRRRREPPPSEPTLSRATIADLAPGYPGVGVYRYENDDLPF